MAEYANGMNKTIDTLRSEHRTTSSRLDLLEREIDALREGATPDYELINLLVQYFNGYAQQLHHVKEDLVYRRLLTSFDRTQDALPDLEEEHEQLAGQVAAFAEAMEHVQSDAEIPMGQIVDICTQYVTAQRKHMELEETLFFPKARERLSDQDWADLEGQIAQIEAAPGNASRRQEADALEQEIHVQMQDEQPADS